jgi:hypothetical protein
VYRNECRSDGTGTVHVVIGTAGAGLEAGGFSNQFGNYSLVQKDDWGYLRVYATETTLNVQVRGRAGHVMLWLMQCSLC